MSSEPYHVSFEAVTGCTKTSIGCRNCYMPDVAQDLKEMGNPRYKNGFKLTIHETEIRKFLNFIGKGKRADVTICGTSDLFHEGVPDDFIVRVLQAIDHPSLDTRIILTKRSGRLLEISRTPQIQNIFNDLYLVGVSVETPEQYYRIRDLQQIKNVWRWLSLAPFLAPMPDLPLEGISTVDLSPEGGPGAQPFDEEAAADVQRQCQAAGVTYHRKEPHQSAREFLLNDGGVSYCPASTFPLSMIFQLIERTGGLQILPRPKHPKFKEWLNLVSTLKGQDLTVIAEMVRQAAPEFFEYGP